MINLLRANFLRLWRNKTFWTGLAVCVFLGVSAATGELRFQASMGADLSQPEVAQYKALLEGVFFQYNSFIGVLAAALISLFLGTEYSDGTIRNKIAVGQSRTAIYFSSLITGFIASALCIAGYMLPCLAVGAPLLGWFTKPASLLVSAVIGSVVMLAAFCAIFTCVTMNCTKKSSAVVICLLGVFCLLFAAVYLYARLEEPEFVTGYEVYVDGRIADVQQEPNPAFLQGMKRDVYQFVYDLLPTGQSIQYTGLLFTSPARLMAMSLCMAVLFTTGGITLFRRKDLK